MAQNARDGNLVGVWREMAPTDVDCDALLDEVKAAGVALPLAALAESALATWLAARGSVRRYAPGAKYALGERIVFEGQWATVRAVTREENAGQGAFDVLTLELADGTTCRMAAGVAGALAEDHFSYQPPDADDREAWAAVRATVREALEGDRRLAEVPPGSDEWGLAEARTPSATGPVGEGVAPEVAVKGSPEVTTAGDAGRRMVIRGQILLGVGAVLVLTGLALCAFFGALPVVTGESESSLAENMLMSGVVCFLPCAFIGAILAVIGGVFWRNGRPGT